MKTPIFSGGVILLLMLLAVPVGCMIPFIGHHHRLSGQSTGAGAGEAGGILTVTITNPCRRESASAAKTECDWTAVSGHGESA